LREMIHKFARRQMLMYNKLKQVISILKRQRRKLDKILMIKMTKEIIKEVL